MGDLEDVFALPCLCSPPPPDLGASEPSLAQASGVSGVASASGAARVAQASDVSGVASSPSSSFSASGAARTVAIADALIAELGIDVDGPEDDAAADLAAVCKRRR